MRERETESVRARERERASILRGYEVAGHVQWNHFRDEQLELVEDWRSGGLSPCDVQRHEASMQSEEREKLLPLVEW